MKRVRFAPAVVALAAMTLALTSCTQSDGEGDGDGAGAGSSAEPAAASSASAEGSSADDNSLTQKTERSADPRAPKRIVPVERSTSSNGPRLPAAQTVGFGETVSYSDGVELDVIAIDQAKVTGQGPGVLSGPMTSLQLVMTNGSNKQLRLSGVVVTAVYGDPARIARPVYSDDERDFGGTVKPGGEARARYAFSVPRADLTDVTVHIDFDSRHAIGVFTGSTIEN